MNLTILEGYVNTTGEWRVYTHAYSRVIEYLQKNEKHPMQLHSH